MKIKKVLLQAGGLAASWLHLSSSFALDISPIPLYAGGGAKPSLLFIVDDSPSMFSPAMPSRESKNIPQLSDLDQFHYSVYIATTPNQFDRLLTSINGPTAPVTSSAAPTVSSSVAASSSAPAVSSVAPVSSEASLSSTSTASSSAPPAPARIASNDETVILSGGVVLATNNANYQGAGFLDFPFSGGELTWMVDSMPTGTQTLNIRYANGSAASRVLGLTVNGVSYGNVTFTPTGGWSAWDEVAVEINVPASTIEVVLVGGDYPSGPNIDELYFDFSGATASKVSPVFSKVSATGTLGRDYLILCPGYNLLAYDPNKTYSPWAGLPNASFPLAEKIPNQPNFGTVDISNAVYAEWHDDGDGVYEFGECGANIYSNPVTVDATHFIHVSSLSAEERQNYANWFTYHRSRIFAFKAGLSPVLEDLRVRAGMTVLHMLGIDPDWTMNITDVDNINNPTLQPQKDLLMKTFYEILSRAPYDKGGTPLRRSLENGGLYFHLDNDAARALPDAGFLPDLNTAPFLPPNQGGACQENHMLLVTDGYQYEFGARMVPKVNWGNVDGNITTTTRTEPEYQIPGLHSDDRANTLGDIAMYFATADANSKIPGVQTVKTHALSFGVFGNLDGFPTSLAEKRWPTPTDTLVVTGTDKTEYLTSLDDLVHAAFNGGGRFMTATDADSLNYEMNELMIDLTAKYKGTATAISFDDQGVSASKTLFRTLYDMEDWSGELNAFNFDAKTATVGSQKWEASAQLDLASPANPRKVVTFNGLKGAAFQAPSSLTLPSLLAGDMNLGQLSDLLADKPVGVNSADYLQDMIEYIRLDGDGYDTNPKFREKTSLGDIVHSSPVFVGAPRGYYPNDFEDSPYLDFVTAKENRTPIVYVGANDGMLHAFNADNGQEIFAYIPHAVFSDAPNEGLHWLADRRYFHLPYVDETPVVSDVYVKDDWRTYLVGGLGRGGKAIYVLDVTDPASLTSEDAIAANVVVTEFSDPYLGYTYGTPRIAKMNDGEWVAIFGNGYNNDADGKAYLYVLYLDGAGPGGVNHVKVGPLGGTDMGSVTNGSCVDSASDCNGLSAPTVIDLNGDGKVDRVYAGDLMGNMWAFDFTKDASGNKITAANSGAVVPVVAHQNALGNKQPLFTACRAALTAQGLCSVANRQPITTKPAVTDNLALADSAVNIPNLMVYFGTGQYLAETDILDLSVQAFYGVWDGGADNGGLQPSDLTAQTLSVDNNGNRTIASESSVTYVSKSQNPVSANYGWMLPLIPGEKVIENPNAVNSVVLFPTRISSNDVCARDGNGFVMGLDLITGGKTDFKIFPSQGADIGIPLLSGGELENARGAPLQWFAPDPDDDVTPSNITIQTEPTRAPRRSSWTPIK